MKDYAPCPLPSTWSGRGGGETKKVYREKLIFMILLVLLSKEKESSVQESRGGPRKSLFKPQFLSQEIRVFLNGTLYGRAQASMPFFVSAVPFLGILWQCRLWFSRPGIGLEFLHLQQVPRRCWFCWSGGSHFYSKALGQSEWAEIGKCHLSALTWNMVKRTAWVSKRLSFKFWLCPYMCYWATLGFAFFICRIERMGIFETIEWDFNVTCYVLSQAHSKW